MRKFKRFLTLSLALVMSVMCTVSMIPSAYAQQDEVASIVEQMTLEQKISQMMIPAIRTWDNVNVTDLDKAPELAAALRKHPYGGLILFAANIKGTEQAARLVYQLQANHSTVSSIPYFTPIDQEGGVVCRLTTGTRMTGNMAIGATGSKARENAEKTGVLIGEELSALGFNMNFAPVADVNNNPANPIIGVRSFSDDPEQVAVLSAAYADGLREKGVIPCFKHFPGHGDTDSDTHIGTASVNKDLSEFEACELVPYRSLISDGVDMIMTAHITMPAYDDIQKFADGTEGYYPATMSKKVITDLLRKKMGYKGVVVTDALEMNALYTSALVPGEKSSVEYAANLAEKIINAGVDMLLIPQDLNSAKAAQFYDDYIDTLESKVNAGTISSSRIDESITRILNTKKKYGILDASAGDLNVLLSNAKEIVGSSAHHALEADLAQQAITMVKNDNHLLPYDAKGKNVVLLTRQDTEGAGLYDALCRLREEGVLPKDACIVNQLTGESVGAEESDTTVTVDCYIKKKEVYESEAVKDADLVIALSVTSGMSDLGEKAASHQGLSKAMEAAQKAGAPFVLLSAKLPYDAARYQDADAIVLSYMSSGLDLTTRADADGSVRNYNANLPAALRSIFGGAKPTGTLPVQIPALTVNADGTVSAANQILYPRGYSSSQSQTKAKNTIRCSKRFTRTVNTKKDQTFPLKASANGAKLSYKSSTKKVKIKDGTVTVTKGFVGKAVITITSAETDKYLSAQKEVTVTVNPSPVKLSSVKAKKKRTVAVAWKRNTTGKGYELVYSTDKKFKKNAKTVKIRKNKTVKTTVKKLKKGKTYYFRIRTVSGQQHSEWSSLKHIKVK